jgi:hypothetical protein
VNWIICDFSEFNEDELPFQHLSILFNTTPNKKQSANKAQETPAEP